MKREPALYCAVVTMVCIAVVAAIAEFGFPYFCCSGLATLRCSSTLRPVALQRLFSRTFDYSLVRLLQKRVICHEPGESEQVWIEKELVFFRSVMLTQKQVPHSPQPWSALLVGVGWCDQINSVGAMALTKKFSRVQLIGAFDPITKAGHSMGRVWLPSKKEWIIFDLWQDDVFVMKLTPGLEIVSRLNSRGEHKSRNLAGLGLAEQRIYRSLQEAQPYVEFGSSALRYAILSLMNRRIIVPPTTGMASGESANGRELRIPPSYVGARLSHLFSRDPKQAYGNYSAFISQSCKRNDSVLRDSADIFKSRLGLRDKH